MLIKEDYFLQENILYSYTAVSVCLCLKEIAASKSNATFCIEGTGEARIQGIITLVVK